MKILHLLSQRPEATGSGIYIQAMIREAARRGHENFLLAGVPQGEGPQPDGLGAAACEFVRFQGGDLPFAVVGMSDIMPYPSTRFADLSPLDVELYERCFADKLQEVVARIHPQLIHSHHLWLLTATARASVAASAAGGHLPRLRPAPVPFLSPSAPPGAGGMPGTGWHHGPERGSKA